MRQNIVLGHYGESSISIFEQFLACIDKIFIWEEDWTLSYNSMKIWDLLDIS